MLLFDYAQQVSLLKSFRAEGVGFGPALRALDAASAYTKKIAIAHPDNYYGFQTAALPHMGRLRVFATSMAAAFFRVGICEVLGPLVTSKTSAVVEFGCGAGDIIACLARDFIGAQTRFYGTDMAADGRQCVELLAKLGRIENLTAHPLDILHPDFGFLGSPTETLLFCTNVFSAVGEGEVLNLMRALQAIPGAVKLCAFEPLHDQISADFPDHLVLTPSSNVGRNSHTWGEVKAAAAEGLITINRIVPDMTGRNPVYSLSLIEIEKRC